MDEIETDVLVVGAGPAGLASAIELGTRGIKVVVAERNQRVGLAPRAKTTNVRTRTHLRRWGIADQLAAQAPFGVDYPNDMVFVTRLGREGFELARFHNAFNASPERSPLYPEHGQWVPQYALERVLLAKLDLLPTVETRFGTGLLAAEQDAEAVTSTLRSGSQEYKLRARYLIGADGARSPTRDLIGAKMEGRQGLSHHYNIIFRAPGLEKAHGFGPAVVYWQIGKEGFSAIGPMDRDDVWAFMPGGAKAGTTLSKEAAADLIRERTGIDLPYEILSADTWAANEQMADRYSDRRIFLAGDACHLHPPAGGYGMNMGVGDAVDLGWKMAATLQGWGGPRLLASYETERRAVHRVVIDEAMANYAIYVAPPPVEIEDATQVGEAVRASVSAAVRATKGREFYTLGTVLGLGYGDSPIIAPSTQSGAHDSQTYTPSARPGSLAPHAWMTDGKSLYDLFGHGFTLLASGRASESEIDEACEEAECSSFPLAIVRPGQADIDALYDADLTLIRPDQFVAWQGTRWERGAIGRAAGWTDGW